MITFSIAVFFFFITPGPAVLSVAGIGSAFGPGQGVRYIAGLFVGTNIVSIAIASGTAAVVLADKDIRMFLLLASVGYLVVLAFKIAFAGSNIAFGNPGKPPGFMSGVILQTVNPKAYAVGTTLFTGFAFFPDSLVSETVIKFIIINAIWVPMHFVWLYAGVYIRTLNLASYIQRRINFMMALSMLIVVGLALIAPK